MDALRECQAEIRRLRTVVREYEDYIEKVERTIKSLITDNEGNRTTDLYVVFGDRYTVGYYEGYHDALVDVMNKLEINHNEKYYND